MTASPRDMLSAAMRSVVLDQLRRLRRGITSNVLCITDKEEYCFVCVLLEYSTSRPRCLLLCSCSVPLVGAAEVLDEFCARVVLPVLGHAHER